MARPKGTTRDKKPITDVEYKKLMAHTKGDENIKENTKEKFLRAWIFLYYTGCRISELTHITVKDIRDIVNKHEFSLMNNTKTKKARLIYFSKTAIKEIQKRFEFDLENLEDRCYVIRSWDKYYSRVNERAFTEQINKYIHNVLGELYSSHSFRSGIITDMLNHGINTKVVKEFIGHASTNTTLRYYKVGEKEIRKSLIR